MSESKKEISYIDGFIYLIGFVLMFSISIYIALLLTRTNTDTNSRIGDKLTNKILGVLYIILYMVLAVWSMIFVRTVYGDKGNTMTTIIQGLVIVTGFSMFWLI